MALIVKDSLGMGIKKKIDKEKKYSDEENEQFTRQLFSEKEKEILKSDGILSIENVRKIIIENSTKDTYDKLDADLLVFIDSRIDYNIYLVEDNIYTYEDLCISFPFKEFNISPESIFVRQVLVIFSECNTSSECNDSNEEDTPINEKIEIFNEGDPIVSTYDLIKIATGKITADNAHSDIKIPKKVIRSKIFIGGDKWNDFLQLRGFFRGMVQVSHLQIDNGQTPEFLKPFTMAINNQLMIQNSSDTEQLDTNTVDTNTVGTNTVDTNTIFERLDNIEKNILLIMSRLNNLENK